MKKKIKKREFTGSWLIFAVLLLFGIVPAIIYWWIKTEEVEITR